MISAGNRPLCLDCGLCCNGVIFAQGELRPNEDPERFRALGLALKSPVRSAAVPRKFHQPCAAFDGCRCRIYSDRPQHCRAFDCLLLQRLNAGEIGRVEALKKVRSARRQAERVIRLLGRLGETDESSPPSVRFRRLQRRMDHERLDPETAVGFGELTLAMHRLNLLLSREFYPAR